MVDFQHVNKLYEGHQALDDVSFNISKGTIFGLLGPNGAGKTTILRLLVRILLPDSGNIFFDDKTLKEEHLRQIGYLPEERGLYPKMRAYDHLVFLARLKGVQKNDIKTRIAYWAEKLQVGHLLSRKVENLSKIYRLGEIGTGTISRDLERWVKMKVMGKEDPFLKIGESNDRSKKGSSDIVYSLKDINFEIQQGDAVGIIGRNGAGKSTLLKILSRVTTPTTGKINIKGRVASLLEVGTGFHSELTGRENIYLNGAILGMKKKEIDRKFDEIVDFAGVERYIDTPVKRYSSGMYVRLAFAVAAHLDPEILIVDENFNDDINFSNKQ